MFSSCKLALETLNEHRRGEHTESKTFIYLWLLCVTEEIKMCLAVLRHFKRTLLKKT